MEPWKQCNNFQFNEWLSCANFRLLLLFQKENFSFISYLHPVPPPLQLFESWKGTNSWFWKLASVLGSWMTSSHWYSQPLPALQENLHENEMTEPQNCKVEVSKGKDELEDIFFLLDIISVFFFNLHETTNKQNPVRTSFELILGPNFIFWTQIEANWPVGVSPSKMDLSNWKLTYCFQNKNSWWQTLTGLSI